MRFNVKISTIEVMLLILSIVLASIMPHMVEVLLRYGVTMYLLVRHLTITNVKTNKVIVALLVLYTGILTYSTHINTSSITWTLSAFVIGMRYLAMFLLFYDFVRLRSIEELVRTLVVVLATLIFINDLLMPLIEFHTTIQDVLYFFGNKFAVSYIHCLFGALVYVGYKKKLYKRLSIVWLVYSLLIAAYVKCSTGIVISAAMLVMACFPGIINWIVKIPFAFPALLGIENILIWGSTNLFKVPWVMNIMTDVFHKSADMTGREKLYAVTLDMVAKKPWFGYGSNTDLYRNLFRYGNAQNGLFHIVTQAGILGAVVYFFMITYALLDKKTGNYAYGIYMFVFSMILGAAVEINLTEIFLIAVAIIYAYQRT